MSEESNVEIAWIVLHIITPLGTALWGLTQLFPTPPTGFVGGAVLTITAAAIFLTFNQTIAYLDARQNSEYREAIGYE